MSHASALATLSVLLGIAHAGSSVAQEMSGDGLLARAETERDAFLDTLETLVNIDSGTGTEGGLAEVEAILTERLEALGAQVETSPAEPSAGNNIVGRLDGTGNTNIMLMIHYDTVFPEGTAAERPFETDDSRAYGPGVADAHGGIALILHSLAILDEVGFDEYGRITVFFNPDEETGSMGSRDMIRELAADQDHVFSYEPADSDAVTIATNGINYVFLDVAGRASHAGAAPDEGRNAIMELSHQLLQLDELGDPEKGTTVNWTIIEGGEARNIIPPSARAEGDMRYSDLAEYDRVLEEAQAIVETRLIEDTEVEFSIERGRPPLPENDATQALADRAAAAYQATGRELDHIAMSFGTDAGYAYDPESDTPAVIETMGLVGAGLHSEDEYIELDSIAPRLYLTAALIMDLSQQ
jgi:glutamate carboxypeptidase